MVNSQPVRVVIVEDDYLVAEEIKRSLRNAPYEVVGEAGDGDQAVKIVRELKPDVVLMDIKMPGTDGLEASRQIQKECPTPIVILTAHESKELVDKASEVGVAAYLIKPPSNMEIERAVTMAIARHDDLMEMCRLNRKLEEALKEIRMLRGILPLCLYCKKIRGEGDNWQPVDVYIHEHSSADISHTICPDCLKKHYAEYTDNDSAEDIGGKNSC